MNISTQKYPQHCTRTYGRRNINNKFGSPRRGAKYAHGEGVRRRSVTRAVRRLAQHGELSRNGLRDRLKSIKR